jgi:hypothetical protein
MKGSDTIIMIRDLHEIQGKSISRIAAELIMSEVFIIVPPCLNKNIINHLVSNNN